MTIPFRVPLALAKVPLRRANAPKRPTWTMALEGVLMTARSIGKNMPRDLGIMRMFSDVGVPGPLLPKGVVRATEHIPTQCGTKIVLEYAWPQDPNVGLNPRMCSFTGKMDRSKDFRADPDWQRIKDTSAIVLYLHGGAYALCNRKTHRDLIFRIVLETGAMVASPEYRRVPDVPIATTVQDAVDAYLHLTGPLKIDPKRIVFMGDSAGGGLVAASLTVLRDQVLQGAQISGEGQEAAVPVELPAGGVLFSPWVDLREDLRPSAKWNAQYDFLPSDLVDVLRHMARGDDREEPLTAPLPPPEATALEASAEASPPIKLSPAAAPAAANDGESAADLVAAADCQAPEEESSSDARGAGSQGAADSGAGIHERPPKAEPLGVQDHAHLHSPILADLHGLPPLLIHVGQCEILHDQIIEFAEKCAASGVATEVVDWRDMVHVFQLLSQFHSTPLFALKQVGAFVRGLTSVTKPRSILLLELHRAEDLKSPSMFTSLFPYVQAQEIRDGAAEGSKCTAVGTGSSPVWENCGLENVIELDVTELQTCTVQLRIMNDSSFAAVTAQSTCIGTTKIMLREIGSAGVNVRLCLPVDTGGCLWCTVHFIRSDAEGAIPAGVTVSAENALASPALDENTSTSPSPLGTGVVNGSVPYCYLAPPTA
ncbi:hypothetical protein CYMTET_49463 [Cymbomonas tetramitiformis]|uniref:Alpha/beta hydrolase fold-3 domain-containing protein n=1 Tax=Cymbomonas tetramitiformis TaxID=36881 RepID=A0AAE0EVS4_9CHLO|nr:hypothetical protein CYMTET_49463 [Cymbomonas tetramitiformis]